MEQLKPLSRNLNPPGSCLSPSSSLLTTDPPALAFARPRSSRTAHYRPFSTLYPAAPAPTTVSPPRSLRRSRSSAFGNMVFKKETDFISPRPESPTVFRARKESDAVPAAAPPSRFTGKLLKKKKSFASLFSPTLHTPTLASPTVEIDGFAFDVPPPLVQKTSSESSVSSTSSSVASVSTSYTVPVASPIVSKPSPVVRTLECDEDATRQRKYVEKATWHPNAYKVKLHPYQDEAPYMRSYENMDMENDRCSDMLYRRLYPKHSPTFHDYGKDHPPSVLDIGCGAGHWMQYAASMWPKTSFTGFDMVDTFLPSLTKSGRIVVFRGNFVEYRWPWPTKTFDLVRICDVYLGVSYQQWQHVIAEAKRVLTPGGRLEIVDDQLFFPYGDDPSSRVPKPMASSISGDLARRRNIGESFFELGEDSDESDEDIRIFDDDDSIGSHTSSEPSTSVDSNSPTGSPDLRKELRLSPPTRPIPSIPELSESDTSTPPASTMSLPKASSWGIRVGGAKDIETQFEQMLFDKSVHPRPSQFLLEALQTCFGEDNCSKRSVHLKIAPPGIVADVGALPQTTGDSDSEDDESWQTQTQFSVNTSYSSYSPSIASASSKRKWINKKKDRRDSSEADRETRSSNEMDPSHRTAPETLSMNSKAAARMGDYLAPPENINAKAAARLGISVGDMPPLSRAPSRRPPPMTIPSSSTVSTRASLDQPMPATGLVMWPRTFLPMAPSELEMHACKHIHTLIGCKVALAEYVTDKRDEHNRQYVSETEFIDALWDYEGFRRERFNWSSDLPSSRGPVNTQSIELPYTPKPSSLSGRQEESSSDGPFGWDELTHVRSIRIFSVVKEGARRRSPTLPSSST